MQNHMPDSPNSHITEQLNNELSKAYIGGLMDGTGSLAVRIKQEPQVKFNHRLEPEIVINRGKPHAIHVMDSWLSSNGIFANIHEIDDRYQLRMNSAGDITRFLEEIQPYFRERADSVEFMLKEILPELQSGNYRDNEETFLAFIDKIERLREIDTKSQNSKYNREYFEDYFDSDEYDG